MSHWTRRDLLKSGVAASAAAASPSRATAPSTSSDGAGAPPESQQNIERERLLLDFGWRFHFGHAKDQAKDFDFGGNRKSARRSPRQATFCRSAVPASTIPSGRRSICRTIGRWACPSSTRPRWWRRDASRWAAPYPETSIGWYRRVFDIPAGDLGRRLSVEFDGVFRNAMVVFNGHYLGESLSGYAPFRYDLTDYANYGSPNVLVVRADATLHEGWFYEGAGIYRHVWLNKTSPLRVAYCGTFVRSQVAAGSASVSIATEIDNDTDAEKVCEVVSTILDSQGNAVATDRSRAVPVAAGSRRAVDRRIAVANPALWSIETPNLYTLRTVIEAGGHAVDRYETPFGIRTVRFDADRGFFLNDRPLKIKGTCNHQDHARRRRGHARPAAVLPPRKAQGDGIERVSHLAQSAHSGTAGRLRPLGMLVLDETRMLPLPGRIQPDRADDTPRPQHPQRVLGRTGNEELEQATERGARIVAAMKRLRQAPRPHAPRHRRTEPRIGQGGFARRGCAGMQLPRRAD